MTPQLVGILAAIVGCQARIEAMKAANQARLALDNSIAYDEDAFLHEAAMLGHFEIEARNAPPG